MTEHVHSWMPLIRTELINGVPTVPRGSLGSQIGYACRCGAEQILWPQMAANHGVTEEYIVRLNHLQRLT